MHRTHALTILSLVIIGIVAVVILSISTEPASAGKPSVPIPVSCNHDDFAGGSSAAFLDCTAADGTTFTDNQRVPNGYYLFVTDIMLTRVIGTEANVQMTLYDAFDTSSRGNSVTFRKLDIMASKHFITPYLILPTGHRLEADHDTDAERYLVRVSGLLVNDVSNWP